MIRTLAGKLVVYSFVSLVAIAGLAFATHRSMRVLGDARGDTEYTHAQLDGLYEILLAADRLGEPDARAQLAGAIEHLRRAIDEAYRYPTPDEHTDGSQLEVLEAIVARLDDAADPATVARELNAHVDAWLNDERAEVRAADAKAAAVSRQLEILILAVAGVGALLIAVVAVLLVPRLRRGLRALAAGCERLAAGDLAAVVPEAGRDELASLGRRFNDMAAHLRVARDEAAMVQQAQAQTAKLAAIGQLASGIAHEINNPLGVILGFAQGLERRIAGEGPMRMPVASIAREALRCKALVEELLVFSRLTRRTAEATDINGAVASALHLVATRAKSAGIEIATELADAPLPVLGHANQLQQIIINLGINGLDAMEEGGTLRILTRRDGATVVLEVSDTGSGIPPHVMSRIFDPFFTTKGPGRGTGLGLSLVHEFVTQHGGTIAVASDPGRGTAMTILFPIAPEAVVEEHAA